MFNQEFNFKNISKNLQARLPIYILFQARIKQEWQFFSLFQARIKQDHSQTKVDILPPADLQVKISTKGQNQTPLLGFMNF